MKNLIFLIVLAFISCKSNDNKQYPITSWTKNMDSTLKLRTELRLAFGKTFANALVNESFRKYIHAISQNPVDSNFNEIVFSVHYKDVIDGVNTFEQILKKYTDFEVKAIFGDSLIQKTLENDPCACIKIPDILYDVKWDPGSFAPCVYVETPRDLGYLQYQVYHASGYQSLIEDFESIDPEHYYIMVKYSEDYTLMNTETWTNEKNISMFEFIPQAQEDWNLLEAKILADAVPSIYGANRVFIKKFKAYQTWSEKFSYKGNYVGDTVTCDKDCPRKCLEQIDFVPTTLDHIQVTQDFFYSYFGGIFRESTSILVGFYSNYINLFANLCGIPAIRFKTLGYKAQSIKLNLKEECYGNIGNAYVPYLKLTKRDYDTPGYKIPIHYIVLNKMKDNPFQFLFYTIPYNDIVITAPLDYYPKPFEIHGSNFAGIGLSGYYYCSPQLSSEESGSLSLSFRY